MESQTGAPSRRGMAVLCDVAACSAGQPEPGTRAQVASVSQTFCRRDRFSTIDKRDRRCLPEPAHAVGEWPRAMARRSRLLPDLRILAAPMLAGTHIGVGGRHDRFSTIDKWGQPGLREPAHGLQE